MEILTLDRFCCGDPKTSHTYLAFFIHLGPRHSSQTFSIINVVKNFCRNNYFYLMRSIRFTAVSPRSKQAPNLSIDIFAQNYFPLCIVPPIRGDKRHAVFYCNGMIKAIREGWITRLIITGGTYLTRLS